MKIYNYNATTKEYIGAGDADESPLEPGQFLIPAHATAIEPPVIPAGQVAVFNGAGWDLVEDHRAEHLWSKATGLPARVTELGPLPSTLTASAPDTPYPYWDEAEAKWKVDLKAWKTGFLRPGRDNALLAADNRVRRYDLQVRAGLPPKETAETINELLLYMQVLRDLPNNESLMPENLTWPEVP